MDKNISLALFASICAAGIGLYIWRHRRGVPSWKTNGIENFTIHQVDEPGCIPSTSSLSYTSSAMNVPLQPNTTRIAVQGYNYTTTPIFYRDGKKIIPVEFAWNSDNMIYYFTLASPNGVCGHEWILETYDFVEPTVVDQDSNKSMKVRLERRRYGFNKWLITC